MTTKKFNAIVRFLVSNLQDINNLSKTADPVEIERAKDQLSEIIDSLNECI